MVLLNMPSYHMCKDLEECIKIIRPYNIEKKEIIKRIDKVLHKYSLFS